MSAVIVLINGATIFASLSKFTKGVGQAIRSYYAERKQEKIQRNLNELEFFRSAVRRRKGERERLSLRKKEKLSPIEEKFYQGNVNATQSQLFAARIECMKRWRFLQRHGALPIDMLTERQWEDFDEYLKAVDVVEGVCA